VVTKSYRTTNVTIKIDQLVLLQARYRALCDRTSVNRLVRQFIEEYAEPAVSDPAALWGHLARPAEPPDQAASSSATEGTTSRPSRSR
jgi:hypothetical protein